MASLLVFLGSIKKGWAKRSKKREAKLRVKIPYFIFYAKMVNFKIKIVIKKSKIQKNKNFENFFSKSSSIFLGFQLGQSGRLHPTAGPRRPESLGSLSVHCWWPALRYRRYWPELLDSIDLQAVQLRHGFGPVWKWACQSIRFSWAIWTRI